MVDCFFLLGTGNLNQNEHMALVSVVVDPAISEKVKRLLKPLL